MRDRLIHGYFSVRWELVLDVVQNEVPEVEPKIRAADDLFNLDRPE